MIYCGIVSVFNGNKLCGTLFSEAPFFETVIPRRLHCALSKGPGSIKFIFCFFSWQNENDLLLSLVQSPDHHCASINMLTCAGLGTMDGSYTCSLLISEWVFMKCHLRATMSTESQFVTNAMKARFAPNVEMSRSQVQSAKKGVNHAFHYCY